MIFVKSRGEMDSPKKVDHPKVDSPFGSGRLYRKCTALDLVDGPKDEDWGPKVDGQIDKSQ